MNSQYVKREGKGPKEKKGAGKIERGEMEREMEGEVGGKLRFKGGIICIILD